MKKIIFLFIWVVLFNVHDVKAQENQLINSALTISQDTTWEGLVVIDRVRVTIAQNATLTIKPGTIISGKNGALIYVMGKLKALGDEDKKIRFIPENNEQASFSLTYYIDSTSTSQLDLEHFILEGGGGNQDTASAPALTIRGKANLSKGIIRRNLITAVRVWGNDVNIKDCEIYENENIALENKSSNTLKVEDNWWGSEDGPTTTSISNSPRALVKGALDFDPWEKKGPIPIIILPGFGGSFSYRLLSDKAEDDWWLTPLGTSAYRYFVKALILNNYYHDKDFFWGFYDWRISCKESAKNYLTKIIDEAKEKSGHSQVHIVAHSMGGLVAQSYTEGDSFRDDVDRLISVGTPHLGSSETYPAWEGGELLDEKKSIYVYLWYLQALNWDWDNVGFIRKSFPSLGEMMPIYDYLQKSSNNQLISYNYQNIHNKFLEDLNSPEKIINIKKKINLGIFLGNGESTLEKIKVDNFEGREKWEDGVPNPLDPPDDTNNGDGTVTVKSAGGGSKLTNNIISLPSKHSDLLQIGAKPILEQLKVKAKFPLLTDILSHFLLTAKGPADIDITDDLNRLLSSKNQAIPESQYHEQEIDEKKLTYADFPTDLGGTKLININFLGKEKDNLKAAAWNFSNANDYQKNEIDLPIVKGMRVNYSAKLGEGELKASVFLTLKNLMVLTDREYQEGKIDNWKTRSKLINFLSEAYQQNSNGNSESAKLKIAEAVDFFNKNISDDSVKNILAESLEKQIINPE